MVWYWEVLRKYAVFAGRARRMEFWMFSLFNSIIAFVLSVGDFLVGSPGYIGSAYGLAVLIPTIAVSVRRLHDTGRSGWWLLSLPVGSMVFGILFSILAAMFQSRLLLQGTGVVCIIAAIVEFVFFVQDSTPGENKYGPNPKGA